MLDVDPANGGEETLGALEARHGVLPDTIQVITGGGGSHYYFQHPGREIKNSVGKLGPGLDIRSDGGQVVAPPSIHPTTGRAYTFDDARHPDNVVLAPVPMWMLAELTVPITNARTSGDTIPQGQRNNSLAREAGRLHHMGLRPSELKAALLAINHERCTPPLPDEEVHGIAASIERYPINETPFRITDVGNAERFAHQHQPYVRYCYAFKAWFVCTAHSVWERCVGNRVMQRMKETVRSIYDEVQRESDDPRRTKLAAHALRSENVQRMQGALVIAQSEPGIAILPDAFDANPMLLGVANGVVDIQTTSLRAYRPEDLITKQSPVVFDASASCPTWLTFLGRIFGGNAPLIAYVQQVIGYCLTGLSTEQAFFLLWGSGSNGKSTLLRVLLALLGDYGLQMAVETLLIRKQDGRATPDLARLQGARLAVVIESDEGSRLAEGVLKQMTGGDNIMARRLYSDPIEFKPSHKILLATNHKPRVKDNTHAMWRRMRLIPFEIQIADHEQDPALVDKLLAELSGILNWHWRGVPHGNAPAGCRHLISS